MRGMVEAKRADKQSTGRSAGTRCAAVWTGAGLQSCCPWAPAGRNARRLGLFHGAEGRLAATRPGTAVCALALGTTKAEEQTCPTEPETGDHGAGSNPTKTSAGSGAGAAG